METLESRLSRQRFKTKYISTKDDSRDCDTKLDTIGFDSIVYSTLDTINLD